MYIYLTTNLLNGMRYVGKCAETTSRRQGYMGSGIYIKRAIAKHGKQQFSKTILEDNITDGLVLCDREIHWIRTLDTISPNGYNLTSGGEGVWNMPPEQEKERKLWMSKLGRSRAGMKYTDEMKQVLSEAHLDERHTDEWKESNSIAQKNAWANGKRRIGYKIGPAVPVAQVDIKSGVQIATFPSVSNAAKVTGHSASKISACANGKKTSFRGYTWIKTQTSTDAIAA